MTEPNGLPSHHALEQADLLVAALLVAVLLVAVLLVVARQVIDQRRESRQATGGHMESRPAIAMRARNERADVETVAHLETVARLESVAHLAAAIRVRAALIPGESASLS
jgi:hypothetical protein